MSKFVMTIFGASGDLTKRKLMPALYSLYVAKRLPEEFEILGVGRTVYEDADYRTYIYNEMEKFVKSEEQNKEISVYGKAIKLTHLVTKILPHSLFLQFIGRK